MLPVAARPPYTIPCVFWYRPESKWPWPAASAVPCRCPGAPRGPCAARQGRSNWHHHSCWECGFLGFTETSASLLSLGAPMQARVSRVSSHKPLHSTLPTTWSRRSPVPMAATLHRHTQSTTCSVPGPLRLSSTRPLTLSHTLALRRTRRPSPSSTSWYTFSSGLLSSTHHGLASSRGRLSFGGLHLHRSRERSRLTVSRTRAGRGCRACASSRRATGCR